MQLPHVVVADAVLAARLQLEYERAGVVVGRVVQVGHDVRHQGRVDAVGLAGLALCLQHLFVQFLSHHLKVLRRKFMCFEPEEIFLEVLIFQKLFDDFYLNEAREYFEIIFVNFDHEWF